MPGLIIKPRSRIYHGLSPLAFRRVVLLLLTLAGLAMVAAALPGLRGV